MNNGQILLVEGRDDEHVVYSLATHYNLPENFRVEEKGGVDRLLETIPVQIKASDVTALGVIIDADRSATAKWNKMKSILTSAGYRDVPTKPDAAGTIVEEMGKPKFGIWIMPDNSIPGILENFARFLIAPDDHLFKLTITTIDEIPKKHVRFKKADRAKADIHTWLAWQKDPGTPLGLAITKRFLDANAPHAAQLVRWLRRLFAGD